jgi:hypothetical protein
MAVIHVGTATTLAAIASTSIDNNDIAYIWLNSWARKMVYDSSSSKDADTINHPYYIRPSDDTGAWIEQVGADDPQAWAGSSIATGAIRSTNWGATEGSEIDLDAGTIKLGGSDDPAFSVTAAGILTAVGANITGTLTAATIDIGGADDSSFHVDVDGNMWLGAAGFNIATNPFAVSNAGVLRAVSGTIGGWTLAATYLSGTNALLKSTGVLSLGTGTDAYEAANRIYIDGPNNKMSIGTTFKVENGTLTASAGTVGGWTLASNKLSAGTDADYIGLIPATGIQLGDSTFADAPFSVTKAGVLKAASGTVGGWTLAAASLTGGNATLSNTGVLTLGTSNDVVIVSAVDDTYRLWTGHATAGSAPFRVTKAGVLTATGATISGTLTATSGTIGGLTLSASALYTGSKTAYDDANAGVHFGTDGIGIGNNVFTVSSAGVLTAISGSVGNWTLSATELSSTGIKLTPGASAEILLGADVSSYANASIGFKNDGSGKLASGNIVWTDAGAITIAGDITSTATITGGTIQTASSGARSVLSNDGLAIYDATTQRAKIGADGAGWFGASDKFAWTSAGVVTAGGWVIGTDSLTSTLIGLHSAGYTEGAEILLGGSATVYEDAIIGLKADGSGKLADGKIVWTSGGDVTIGDATRYIKYDGHLTIDVDANVGTGVGIIYKDGKRWLYDFNPAHNGSVQPVGYNLFIGVEAGNLDIGDTATSGDHSSYNIGVGYRSLYGVTKGAENIGIGYLSLYSTTEGSQNIGLGHKSSQNITTGDNNIGIGSYAVYGLGNITGDSNIGIGYWALYRIGSGEYNTAIGYNALAHIYTGDENIGIGSYAGFYDSSGADFLSSNTNSVFIGRSSKGDNDGDDNEIVIGYNAIGNGSNTITLGNTSITALYTSGNIILSDAKYIATDEVSARDGDGLKLYDDGGNGIFIKDGGSVGIGTTTPGYSLHIVKGTYPQVVVGNSQSDEAVKYSMIGGQHYTASEEPISIIYGYSGSSDNIVFIGGGAAQMNAATQIVFSTAANQTTTAGTERMKINSSGYVGIGTTAPGQILDVNQGSGNMIADGYDTHSLSEYKEDIQEIKDDLLSEFVKMPIYKYRRKPYVSADELAKAAISEFGEKQWQSAFPEGYRNCKLQECSDSDIKTFLDATAEQLRIERRELPIWQTEHIGLIADDPSIAKFPALQAKNSKGEVSGISLSEQVGLLHGVIKQLAEKVINLEAQIKGD